MVNVPVSVEPLDCPPLHVPSYVPSNWLVADALIVRYVNRLSDLLFVLARVVNRRAGVPEIEW